MPSAQPRVSLSGYLVAMSLVAKTWVGEKWWYPRSDIDVAYHIVSRHYHGSYPYCFWFNTYMRLCFYIRDRQMPLDMQLPVPASALEEEDPRFCGLDQPLGSGVRSFTLL